MTPNLELKAEDNFWKSVRGQRELTPEQRKEIEIRAEQHVQELHRNAEECKQRGHLGPVIEPLPYCPSNQGEQKVMVMCQHCFGSWYRELNEKEQKQLHDFYDSLREPFTI